MPSRAACLILCLVALTIACDAGTSTGDLEVPFASLFVLEDTIPLRTAADDPLGNPGDLVLWNGRIAISDRFAHNVKIFNADGSLWKTIGRIGDGPAEFRHPASLVVDAEDRLAVLSRLHGKVSFFGGAGELLDEFSFRGSMTTGMRGLDGGNRLLIGTWLANQDAELDEPQTAHVFTIHGELESSFADRQAPRTRAESPFMSTHIGVLEDSIALWGTTGRRTFYRRALDASTPVDAGVDSFALAGLPIPDFSEAPEDDMALLDWAAGHAFLGAILSGPGGGVLRFFGGRADSSDRWYRYAIVSADDGRTLAVTERTPFQVHYIDGSRAYGVVIAADGEAYLTRYSLGPLIR